MLVGIKVHYSKLCRCIPSEGVNHEQSQVIQLWLQVASPPIQYLDLQLLLPQSLPRAVHLLPSQMSACAEGVNNDHLNF